MTLSESFALEGAIMDSDKHSQWSILNIIYCQSLSLGIKATGALASVRLWQKHFNRLIPFRPKNRPTPKKVLKWLQSWKDNYGTYS